MEWLKRMNAVLDYIENNIDGEITDSKIAVLSATSQGMFQRFFTVITDMTLAEYIRKRRLTQSAFDIQNTNAKIIDIAVKYGYNSAKAFSSAFKKFHGITPSEARTSGTQVQSFHRFTFKFTLSIKGGNDMKYRIIEKEAENILQKMVNREHPSKFLQNISERNGAKFACDGHRVGVILPEDIDDWNFDDVYFDTGNEIIPKMEVKRFFNVRDGNSYNFEISKEQAAVLLGILNHFNDFTEDFKFSYGNSVRVCVNINTMEIIKNEIAMELSDKSGERIMAFNVRYLREALKFIMCSDDESIGIYYNGNKKALIMKSSRLYTLVLPVIIKK